MGLRDIGATLPPGFRFYPSDEELVGLLLSFFTYLAIAGSILPGKIVPGVTLTDGTRLHYRCNGLLLLLVLIALLGIGTQLGIVSPTAIADRGLELLSTTFVFSVLMGHNCRKIGIHVSFWRSSLDSIYFQYPVM